MLEQLVELLERLRMLVPLQQRQRVVVARRMIVGREHQHAFEQQFRIVEHVELHADPGEQPHRFDMVAVLQQIVANQALGREHLAVGEHAGGGDDLRRQLRERRDVSRGGGGFGMLPGHPE